jgi:eukaryotic-like serine/threonine-protein kinase
VLAQEGRLTPARTMDLVARIADALQAVHDFGVVHRELGPDRVLIRPDGTVALSVLGLAHFYGLMRQGSVPPVSAVRHASPEELRGEAPSTLSDIYSLGAIAYHCLTARTPFDGDNPFEVAYRTVMDEPPPLPTELPKLVRSIVEHAIAKKPGDRWQTAAAFGAAARGVRPWSSRRDLRPLRKQSC